MQKFRKLATKCVGSNTSDQIVQQLRRIFDSDVTITQIMSRNKNLQQISPSDLEINLKKLEGLYTKKKLSKIAQNSPNIFTDDFDLTTDLKHMYLNNIINVSEYNIINSVVYSRSFNNIVTRHSLLERMGLFVRPKNQHASTTNPSFSEIMDTSKENFCKNVAFISLNDYHTFCKMIDLELNRESFLKYNP